MAFPPPGHPHYMSDEDRASLTAVIKIQETTGMSSAAAAKYANLREKIAEAKKTMKATAKTLFNEMVEELFSDNPDLVAFSWTQYTPYWNDGETCTFRSNSDYPSCSVQAPNGKVVTYDENYGELKDEDGNEVEEGLYAEEEKKLEGLTKKVSKFMQVFEDEDLETMFGDHVEVLVNRDGKIKITEYEHD